MKLVTAEITFYVKDDTEDSELHRLVGRMAEALELGESGPDKGQVVEVDEYVNYGWKYDTTGQD